MKKIIFWSVITFVFFVSCESADDLFNKGIESYNNGDYEQSVLFYTKAIKKKPIAQYYYNRANAYHLLEKYNTALDDYNEAINNDKDYYDAYFSRAINFYVLEEYQNSIDDMLFFTRTNTNSYDAYYYLGNSYLMLQDSNKAIEAYTKAINVDPERIDAYNTRGYIYYALNNYRAARNDFNKSLAIEPKNDLAEKGISDIAKAEREARAKAEQDMLRRMLTDPYGFGQQMALDSLFR